MIVLMRHAEAGHALHDADRRLTAAGLKSAEEKALQLKTLVQGFDVVLVSPYFRALETLDAVIAEIPSAETQVTDELVPDASPNVGDYLAYLDSVGNIVLAVTHLPLISHVAEYLSPGFSMGFAPSDFCVLEREEGKINFKCVYSSFGHS